MLCSAHTVLDRAGTARAGHHRESFRRMFRRLCDSNRKETSWYRSRPRAPNISGTLTRSAPREAFALPERAAHHPSCAWPPGPHPGASAPDACASPARQPSANSRAPPPLGLVAESSFCGRGNFWLRESKAVLQIVDDVRRIQVYQLGEAAPKKVEVRQGRGGRKPVLPVFATGDALLPYLRVLLLPKS